MNYYIDPLDGTGPKPAVYTLPLKGYPACHHPQVTKSLEVNGMVDIECDDCLHRWMSIRLTVPR